MRAGGIMTVLFLVVLIAVMNLIFQGGPDQSVIPAESVPDLVR